MSIFNALGVAVSGINAQSVAFSNLSNNIANSQTVGYKADSTAFQDFVSGSLTGSSRIGDRSVGVGAVTVQHVDRQGVATASVDPLAVTISGNGLFNVSRRAGQATSGTVSFSPQQYYTRNGEFYQDRDGYLVNTSNYYLDGYMADPKTGRLGGDLTQINVSNVVFRPTTTTIVTANAAVGTLPPDGGTGKAAPQHYNSPEVTAYDANSNPYQMGMSWTQSSDNPLSWKVSAYATSPDGQHSAVIGQNSATVTFNSDGTLKSVVDGSGNQISGNGAKARFNVPLSYDGVGQNVAIDLGTIGGKSGVVMASSTGSPTPSAVASLNVDDTAQKITMPADTKIGTASGSVQNYMTAPAPVGTDDKTSTSAKWVQTSALPPSWTVQMVDPYTNKTQSGVYNVVFNSDGSVQSVKDANGASTLLSALTANIGGKSYAVDLGGTSLSTASSLPVDSSVLKTDSVTSGLCTGIEIGSDGSVVAGFDNGDTQLVGKIALSTFANVNGLHAVDGQAYTVTRASGSAQTGLVGENGTAGLTVGYVEASTTDLTSDLSSLIIAQEAYTANTKIVTTADTLLQTTIAMKTS